MVSASLEEVEDVVSNDAFLDDEALECFCLTSLLLSLLLSPPLPLLSLLVLLGPRFFFFDLDNFSFPLLLLLLLDDDSAFAFSFALSFFSSVDDPPRGILCNNLNCAA